MPSRSKNKLVWETRYDWRHGGEEWSHAWGATSDDLWRSVLFPRLQAFLPTNTILEIGPGYGRWTEYLKSYCERLVGVDISPKCIDYCSERFKNCSHMTFFVNDGVSLDMVENCSVDFVFSFDSLVHSDMEALAGYISQLSAKLKPNGAAFIHHSNLGEYRRRNLIQSVIRLIPGALSLLEQFGVENVRRQWRDPGVTAVAVAQVAKAHGLRCVLQELVNWETKNALIDCISIISRQESCWMPEGVVVENRNFYRNLGNPPALYQQIFCREEQA